jgi:hypothetical protein
MRTRYIKLLSLAILATTSIQNSFAQYTLVHSKGASGRNYTTVKMLKEGSTTEYENVTMQSAHTLRQTIYINTNETAKTVWLQTSKIGGNNRIFRYDTHTNDGLDKMSIATSPNYTLTNGDGVVKNCAWSTFTLGYNASLTNYSFAVDLTYKSSPGCSIDKTNKKYTEPTLAYRMIYDVKPAEEMAEMLEKCIVSGSDTTYLETYDMVAPGGGKEIMFGPKYPFTKSGNFAPNYYTYTSSAKTAIAATSYDATVSGYGKFYWNKQNGNTLTKYTTGKLTGNGHIATISSGTAGTTEVYVLTDGTHYLAKFTIKYESVDKVGPKVEDAATGDSAIYTDKYLSSRYKLVAERTFDHDGSTVGGNYAWNEPLDFDECSYAFAYNVGNYTHKPGDYTGISIGQDWSIYDILSNSSRIDYNAKTPWAYKTFFDRTYIDSKGTKGGYFMYLDAAETQGTVANLDITDAACPGTKLYVSAWIADVNLNSGYLPPNLNFQIVGIKSDGTETIVKTFTTGSLTHLSEKWNQIYFSMIMPENTISKLRMRIINNNLASNGNDFLIDNIRVFMDKPAVQAQQEALLCGNTAKVKVHINYEQLLKIKGWSAEQKSGTDYLTEQIGFCIVDSTAYWEAVNSGTTPTAAFENARVVIDNTNITNGTGTYTSKFLLTTHYDTYWSTYSETNMETTPWAIKETYIDKKSKGIYLLETISDKRFAAGKTYYIVFNKDGGDDDATTVLASGFALDKSCDVYTTFKLKGSGTFLVDGLTSLYSLDNSLCYNETPTIAIDSLGYMEGENVKWVKTSTTNMSYDWYQGDIADFDTDDATYGISPKEALRQFRLVYYTSEKVSAPVSSKAGLIYTPNARSLLMRIFDEGKLTLNRRYFSPTNLKAAGSYYYVAVPIVKQLAEEYTTKICTDPQVVNIICTDDAPVMKFGLNGVNYPSIISSVGLRAGLDEIKHIINDSPTEDTKTDANTQNTLKVPISYVNTISNHQDVAYTNLIYSTGRAHILYLCDSNDTLMLDKAENFTPVGYVTLMNAVRNSSGAANNIRINLYSDFGNKLREGYEYDLKFFYNEESTNHVTYPVNACDGNVILPLKIVPAYVKWTGNAENGAYNWDNDNNWERAELSDFDADAKTTYTSNADNYKKDSHAKERCYSPLGFTRAILPAGNNAQMYSLTPKSATDASMDMVTHKPSNVGSATKNIEYDMLIHSMVAANNSFDCITYTGNLCQDIYLKPQAELMNAQYLKYNSAHVDFQVTPNRWYLLSSPLQGVFSGDMYTLTSGYTQNTDAFSDITFDASANNRYNPAVYQRSWDKATSTIYEIDGVSSRNVALKANWSNVYNDVNVAYAPGIGFSVKATRGDNATGDILFRLPKADNTYLYYNIDKTTTGNSTNITRDNTGKLMTDKLASGSSFTVTPVNASDCNLRLLGNPFPCQMDMSKFFDGNTTNYSSRTYWLMTAEGQTANILNTDGSITTTSGTVNTIAPLQGFFVKGSGDVTFTADMMTALSNGENNTALKAPAQTAVQELRVSAERNGDRSNMVIIQRKDASNTFVDGEDAEVLLNSDLKNVPTVYSIAGQTAAQINVLNTFTNIPIGIYSNSDDSVNVTFSGMKSFGKITLNDCETKSSTELNGDGTDNYTVSLPGNTGSQRFYLSFENTTSINDINANNDWTTTVYTPDGALIGQSTNGLPTGVYIVKSQSKTSTIVRKIIINK